MTDFKLAYYSSDRIVGQVTSISSHEGKVKVQKMPTIPSSIDPNAEKSIFVGLTEDDQAVLLNPVDKTLSLQNEFPEDAFAAHMYCDPTSDRAWFMNDGDKETGNDQLNCGNEGSSVTLISAPNSKQAQFVKTICVGRGHHQAHFSYPTNKHPNIPACGWISNLKDGTISVIDNDEKSDRFLEVIQTINLCEPDKEKEQDVSVPNNAFPHGLVFSEHSGKVYNLNNGYGTVAIIDPINFTIESRLDFKGHSNLFVPRGGRYVFGRGADRKSNPEHVIAKLSLLDVETLTVAESLDLEDVYISKYFFNPECTRLYLTTSSSGNDEQKKNLKTDALLVFDISNLPQFSLINEARLGSPAGTLDFLTKDNVTQKVFSSHAENGQVLVLDINGQLLESIDVDEKNKHSRLWCY